MSRTIAEDRKIGNDGEQRVQAILSQQFNDTLTKTDRYNPMDWAGCGCWVELKTRPYTHSSTYPTLMLSYSKIEFAKKSDRPVYIVFQLKDGLFYITFNEELFGTFEIQEFQRQGRDIVDKEDRVIHIPTKHLTKINIME